MNGKIPEGDGGSTMTAPKTEDRETAYVATVLAEAEAGDWRTVLERVARSGHLNAWMVGDLIRTMQSCYAAGILHGNAQGMLWLGNSLAPAGNMPDEFNPDPTWYGSDRQQLGGSDGQREVPENCATLNEPGTAPSVPVHPGFTGMDPRCAQASDGRWWATASQGIFNQGAYYVMAFTDRLPGSRDLSLDVDTWRSKQDGRVGARVDWWRPTDLPANAGQVNTRPDGPDGPELTVFALDGKPCGFVRTDYVRWIEANLPDIGDSDWVIDQMGGPLGALRWTDPADGQAWAYLMPVNLQAASS